MARQCNEIPYSTFQSTGCGFSSTYMNAHLSFTNTIPTRTHSHSASAMRVVHLVTFTFLALVMVIAIGSGQDLPLHPCDDCNPITRNCNGVDKTVCRSNGDGTFSCHCNDNFVSDCDKQRCILAPSKPGDDCVPAIAPCTGVPDTECDPDSHTCKCKADFATDPDGQRCIRFPTRPGQTCEPPFTTCVRVGTDPPGPSATCTVSDDGLTYYCKCNGDYVTDRVRERCLTIPIYPGDSCEIGLTPCEGEHLVNTTCAGSSCTCIPPLITDLGGRRCLAMPTLPGHICHPTLALCTQVEAPTTCQQVPGQSEYTCRCSGSQLPVTDPDNNYCLARPSRPSDRCHPVEALCQSGDGQLDNTVCTAAPDNGGYFFCECIAGLITDHVNRRCFPPPSLPGDACDPALAPCTDIDHTECHANGTFFQCICTVGWVTDTENGICHKIPENPGDVCDPKWTPCKDVDNTFCDPIKNKCWCTPEYATDPDVGRCLLIPILPGQQCEPDFTDCTRVVVNPPTTTTTCTASDNGLYNYCKCDGKFFTDESRGRCLKIPGQPGDECELPFTPCDVIANTTCIGSECICDNDLITDPSVGHCYAPPTKPGHICHPDLAPCDTIVPPTLCEQPPGHPVRTCRCSGDEFPVTDPDNNYCLAIPSRPSDPCHPDEAPCVSDDGELEDTFCIRWPEEDSDSFSCRCKEELITDPYNRRCFPPPKAPGDACHPTLADCSEVDHTVCRRNDDPAETFFECRCNDGWVTDPVNGICHAVPGKPGDVCDPDWTPCEGVDDTFCDELTNTCKCTDDFATDPVGGRCVRFPLRPGQKCEPGLAECERIIVMPLVSATCTRSDETPGSPFYYCKCDGEYYTDQAGQRCMKIPTYPGDPCDPDLTPCENVGNTTCILPEYECRCDVPLITDPEAGRCLTMPTKPGHICHPNLAPCTAVEFPTVCEKPVSDIEHTCRCIGELPVTDPDNNICITSPLRPGDKCHPSAAPCTGMELIDTDCELDDMDAPDQNGYFYCRCKGDLITDPGNGRCFTRPAAPGDICDPTLAPCIGLNLTNCEPDGNGGAGFFCKCEPGYITAYRRCVPVPRRPGDECHPALAPCDFIPDTTCLRDNSTTDEDIFHCKCTGDLITDRGHCLVPPTRPGDRCSPEIAPCTNVPGASLCASAGADEEDLHCLCNSTLHWTDFNAKECVAHPTAPGQRCDPKQQPNESCADVGNSTCAPAADDPHQAHTCTCNSGFVPSPNVCMRLPTKPSDPCWADQHCRDIPNTECKDDECKCVAGYDLNAAGNACLKKATYIGDVCETTAGCSLVAGTECYVPPSGGNGICTCRQGYVPSERGSYCVVPVFMVGQNCQETVQCVAGIGQGSTCTFPGAVCECLNGFVSNSAMSRCLQTAGYNQRCEESQQCTATLGARAECHPTRLECTCNSESGHMNERCYQRIPLGAKCGRDEECIMGTNDWAFCHAATEKCECGRGAIPWREFCYANISIGDACETNEQCSVPIRNGTCTSGKVCGCGEIAPVPVEGKYCLRASDGWSMLLGYSQNFSNLLILALTWLALKLTVL